MNRTHGRTRTPEWRSWQAMKQRCLQPSDPAYAKYGGRGITICSEWIDSFEAFLADMGPRPEGTTLDRRDNDGPYSPENCRWATTLEQNRNRSIALTIAAHGEVHSVAEWSIITGLKQDTISNRRRKGWPDERCVDPDTSKSAYKSGQRVDVRNFKLTDAQVLEIRSRLGAGTSNIVLAREYDVSTQTIWAIGAHRLYTRLP